MSRTWIGLGLLAVVVIGSVALTALGGIDGLTRMTPERREPVTVSIYFGGRRAGC